MLLKKETIYDIVINKSTKENIWYSGKNKRREIRRQRVVVQTDIHETEGVVSNDRGRRRRRL